MKHSFLLIAAAILLLTVSCKNNTTTGVSNTETYVGTWIVESNGNLNYTISDSAKTLPIVMVDTMVVTASDKSGYCHIKCGKLDEDAQVTSSGLQIPKFVKEDSVSGIAYQYSYNLTITNEPATVTLGIMTWKSSLTGTIAGGTIGIEASYSVTGSLTNRGVKKN